MSKVFKKQCFKKFYQSFSTFTNRKSIPQHLGCESHQEDQCSSFTETFILVLKCHREYYQKYILKKSLSLGRQLSSPKMIAKKTDKIE